MKHIVKVLRYVDKKVRFYALPEDDNIVLRGSLVKVAYRGAGETYGETISDSRLVTDDEYTLVKDALGVTDDFIRVRAVSTDWTPCLWVDELPDVADPYDTDTDTDTEDEEQEDAEG